MHSLLPKLTNFFLIFSSPSFANQRAQLPPLFPADTPVEGFYDQKAPEDWLDFARRLLLSWQGNFQKLPETYELTTQAAMNLNRGKQGHVFLLVVSRDGQIHAVLSEGRQGFASTKDQLSFSSLRSVSFSPLEREDQLSAHAKFVERLKKNLHVPILALPGVRGFVPTDALGLSLMIEGKRIAIVDPTSGLNVLTNLSETPGLFNSQPTIDDLRSLPDSIVHKVLCALELAGFDISSNEIMALRKLKDGAWRNYLRYDHLNN